MKKKKYFFNLVLLSVLVISMILVVSAQMKRNFNVNTQAKNTKPAGELCINLGGACTTSIACSNRGGVEGGIYDCSRKKTCCSFTGGLSKRVFVTSLKYNGNLGGLLGADAKCQERANSANLDGNWKAWLSDNSTSASSRFTQSNAPYLLTSGTMVASNWNDLTDGNLDNIIILTESGSLHGNDVWTGTNEQGEIHNPGASKCMEWSALSNESPSGSTGRSGSADYRWTWGNTRNCADTYPLYCFEQ